jgi:CubicO group peptidase (beta-lactamase class C family)
VFQWFDSPAYREDNPHALWSASKTISSTIAAAAIQKQLPLPQGGVFSAETYLSAIIPFDEHVNDLEKWSPLKKKSWQKMPGSKNNFYIKTSTRPRNTQEILREKNLYEAIQIKHLIMMGSGFAWDESYESDPVKSSFIPMLYGRGAKNMAAYALGQPMAYAPGTRWNYSGGNSVILMEALRRILPKEQSNRFPEDLLFGPLGIHSAVFEQDASGTFVGSSYVYIAPEDLLKIGYLYAQDGVWNGQRILPEGWTHQAQILSEALTAKPQITPYDYIESEGVFSNATFWLNIAVPGNWTVNGKLVTEYGPEFPKSPSKMFFAAGHYGQLLIILPEEELVIARTGHDAEYWSQIDDLASKAKSCFSGGAR